jgi:hypothetical protein
MYLRIVTLQEFEVVIVVVIEQMFCQEIFVHAFKEIPNVFALIFWLT